MTDMRLRTKLSIGAVAATMTLGFIPASAVASSPPVRNGGYVEYPGSPNIVVEFVVGSHGTRLNEDGVSCKPDAALVAQGVTAQAQQNVPLPEPLPARITPEGNLSYSTTVTLTPAETQSTVSVTSPLILTIHFLRPAKVVVGKTLMATGTVSVPNVCLGSSTHFRLSWDPSARL